MITLQLLATVSIATLTAYLAAGVATYLWVPGDLTCHRSTTVFVVGWPLVWIARDAARRIEEIDGLQLRDEDPNKWRDETRE